MNEFPKGSPSSLLLKNVIEQFIKTRLRLNPEDFDMQYFDRVQIDKMLEKINEEYTKIMDRPTDRLIWQDFFDWYKYYHE